VPKREAYIFHHLRRWLVPHDLVHKRGERGHTNAAEARGLRALLHAESRPRRASPVDGVHHVRLAPHLLDHALGPHEEGCLESVDREAADQETGRVVRGDKRMRV